MKDKDSGILIAGANASSRAEVIRDAPSLIDVTRDELREETIFGLRAIGFPGDFVVPDYKEHPKLVLKKNPHPSPPHPNKKRHKR